MCIHVDLWCKSRNTLTYNFRRVEKEKLISWSARAHSTAKHSLVLNPVFEVSRRENIKHLLIHTRAPSLTPTAPLLCLQLLFVSLFSQAFSFRFLNWINFLLQRAHMIQNNWMKKNEHIYLRCKHSSPHLLAPVLSVSIALISHSFPCPAAALLFRCVHSSAE